jgi:hypothetical protein
MVNNLFNILPHPSLPSPTSWRGDETPCYYSPSIAMLKRGLGDEAIDLQILEIGKIILYL